jgi:hypothetical protein
MAFCGARVPRIDFSIDQAIERHRSAPREHHAQQDPHYLLPANHKITISQFFNRNPLTIDHDVCVVNPGLTRGVGRGREAVGID